MDDVKIKVIDSDKLINAINEGSYEVNLSAVMALGAVMLDTKKTRCVLSKSDGTLTIEVPKEEFEGATRILLCEEGTKFVTMYYPESEEDDD